ncbi:uncharacterized protein [Ambystoma mexicanum]|uniref:uncharacterized protein n=1 Tax=Ambystoma mexicanum TaxID=8296 RepID=UPI0037E80B13
MESNGRTPFWIRGEEERSRPAVHPVVHGIPAPQCYDCGEWGHISRFCPRKRGTEPMEIGFMRTEQGPRCQGLYEMDVRVDGNQATALLDSGSRQTAVLPTVSDSPYLTNVSIPIRCIHGDVRTYPLKSITVEVGPNIAEMRAAVLPSLPAPVVIGTDLPHFHQTIKALDQGWWEEAPFAREPIPPNTQGRERPARKRRGALLAKCASMYATQRIAWNPEDQEDSIRGETLTGPTLTLAHERAITDGDPDLTKGAGFTSRQGLLYRVYQEEGGARREQLLLPKTHRGIGLQLAHNHPCGGHMASLKTQQNILKRFYWPGVYGEVAKFCKECKICQLTSGEKPAKAPLQRMPLITIPFQRIGIDLVGPLEPVSRGYRYLLVIVDYATRYPEAFPLKGTSANQICDQLILYFARVGLPTEILTDQGTNFMSAVMRQVCERLQIRRLRTSVYHPQKDGLVERYNQTIKKMMKRVTGPEGKDWDGVIPLILMVLRDTPQSSTGFSPFELLFGRQPRTILDLVKEDWENTKETSLTEYAEDLKKHLSTLRGLAESHLSIAQDRQEKTYNKGCRLIKLEPGDKVLVLLPTSTNKMLARWRGSYVVKDVVGPVNYRIYQPDRSPSHKVYHINLLKKWTEPAPVDILATQDTGVFHATGQLDAVQWGETLTEHMKNEILETLKPHLNTFSHLPGRTSLMEHRIETLNGHIVQLRPYRIPEARRLIIKKEIEEIIRLDIIEPSTSAWCSPIVLVPKPDGAVRFCMDFRQLNMISHYEAYPMARMDELLERLGAVRYLSTLDLTKGYWQIPLRESDKEKNTFATPQGLFQYKVLPFRVAWGSGHLSEADGRPPTAPRPVRCSLLGRHHDIQRIME